MHEIQTSIHILSWILLQEHSKLLLAFCIMEKDYRQNLERGERSGGRRTNPQKLFNQRDGYFLEQHIELEPCPRCMGISFCTISEPTCSSLNDTGFAPWRVHPHRVRPHYKISIIRVYPKILCLRTFYRVIKSLK